MTRNELIDQAAGYLTGCGITVLDRDWYHAEGVVDIAAEERGQFVIVRVLAHPGRGKASPQVSAASIRRMRRLAVDWMNAHGKRYDRVRTDPVVILALPMGQHDLTHARALES